jgi:hypothetical protein
MPLTELVDYSGYSETFSNLRDARINIISGFSDRISDSLQTISGRVAQLRNIPPLCVPFSVGAVTYTNMPANLTFFNNSSAYVTAVNLESFTGVKLSVNKAGTALVTGFLQLKFLNSFSITPTDYLNIDDDATKSMINVQNTIIDSGWHSLVPGTRGNIYVTLIASGGNGVLDPVFGNINAFFM